MDIEVRVGDVLNHSADVLISTANPWLNMSGGVNGAILAHGREAVQQELRDYLASTGEKAVPAGTAVRTSAGNLPFAHIIHAVAIGPFYDSSVELVRTTLTAALGLAASLGARSISTPTLATGYGPLTIDSFARALREVVADRLPFDRITVVVRTREKAEAINAVLVGRD